MLGNSQSSTSQIFYVEVFHPAVLFLTLVFHIYILSCFVQSKFSNTIFMFTNSFLNCVLPGISHLLILKAVSFIIFHIVFPEFLIGPFIPT